MDKSILERWFYEQTGVGIAIPDGGNENRKVHCPWCHDSRKNQRDKSLWLNVNTGLYKCYHCERKGIAGIKKKEYVRPAKTLINLSDRAKEFLLLSRCLSPAIVDMQIIGSGMSRVGKEYITFNYIKDGVHVNTKYRSIDVKEFRMESGAELCLYNGDVLKLAKEVVICEGELDALSWISVGVHNAVSVPNGASNNTSYLDEYIAYFDKVETVYLSTDDDQKGIELQLTIADRIGRDKCKLIRYPEGCKDSNSVLTTYGLNEGARILLEAMQVADFMPIEGVITVSDVIEESMNYMLNGYPEVFPVGIPGLDRLWTIFPGDTTIFVGAPGAGKSNLVDLVAVNVCLAYQYRIAIVSREKSPALHLPNLIRKAVREEFPNKETIQYVSEYLNDQLFYVMDYALEDILKKAESLIKSRGIKMLVIDNLSSIEMKDMGSDAKTVGNAMNLINGFAKRYRIPVLMVAHPRKMEPLAGNPSYFVMPTGYDIIGSSQFFNLVDNIVAIGKRQDYVEFATRKIRYMEFVAPTGDLGIAQVNFSRKEGGVYNSYTKPEDEALSYVDHQPAKENYFEDLFT